MAQDVRVIVAEDNEDLRELIVCLLDAEPDIECVGQTGSLGAVEPLCLEYGPNVVILDIELQGESSLRALPALRARLPAVRFIMYSGHAHPQMIRGAIAVGAAAYVVKTGDPQELVRSIRSVFKR
jgi:two-component system response regulator DesR